MLFLSTTRPDFVLIVVSKFLSTISILYRDVSFEPSLIHLHKNYVAFFKIVGTSVSVVIVKVCFLLLSQEFNIVLAKSVQFTRAGEYPVAEKCFNRELSDSLMNR